MRINLMPALQCRLLVPLQTFHARGLLIEHNLKLNFVTHPSILSTCVPNLPSANSALPISALCTETLQSH